MEKFSTVWKTFFHGVEKYRKNFPWYGKILNYGTDPYVSDLGRANRPGEPRSRLGGDASPYLPGGAPSGLCSLPVASF
jgi:hypothetical protein